ncbi:MAG: membrane protein insertion efficiency factor YidD [Proteobacteria bacterium]|nr:membrane protein insertion efficiency factor YidD [Pseudomonadota bacterium]
MINRIIIALIRCYQNRGGGNRYFVDCNFEPSCSEYARQAFTKYPFGKAMRLTINRIKRCNDPNCWPRKKDPLP